MNIRYRFKDTETGIITTEIMSLEEVEMNCFPQLSEGWIILSRDLGTGLKDKNKIEMFQNDKIKDERGNIYMVIWSDLKAGWLAYSETVLGYGLSSGEAGNLEIIGTVYDEEGK